MQLIPHSDFIDEMERTGVSLTGTSALTFGRYAETDRFWIWPWPPQDLLSLLSAILAHAAPREHCDLWRPGGIWHEDEPSFIDSIRETVLRGFAIPADHRGALRFARSESTALLGLLLSFAFAGWNVNDDLCAIPDMGDYIIRISHHAVVHVEARNTALTQSLVAHMASQGWDLPTDVPDSTFKIPSWMAVPAPEAPI